MEVERVAEADGRIALWAFEWDSSEKPPVKVNRQLLGYEHAIRPPTGVSKIAREAICWSYGRTLGNIAVFAEQVLESFPNDEGGDAILNCDVVEAGKMRNGAKRWWCRTHQRHWGTKADIANARNKQILQCSNHMQGMSYIIDPPHLRMEDHAEILIWCSMPPALTSREYEGKKRPKIHVDVRTASGGPKVIDQEFDAISVLYNPAGDLFSSSQITKVNITPPAAFEFVVGLEFCLEMACINCRDCGYPHLDLGEFSKTPHSKHLCGNCGRDNTWSNAPIASTPLKPLHDQFSQNHRNVHSGGKLNIDDYPGADFAVWASTPAIIWKSHRAQVHGIRVQLWRENEQIINDVFDKVIYRGIQLNRDKLFELMIAHTIV